MKKPPEAIEAHFQKILKEIEDRYRSDLNLQKSFPGKKDRFEEVAHWVY
jgi:hypothetical protein